MNIEHLSDPLSEDCRVVLWDIDGTLIRSARTDAFKDYTVPILEKVFGTAGRLSELKVSGMTDLQIIAEALRDEGFTHAKIRERATDLRAVYMQEMERVTAANEKLFYALPGAREALQAIEDHPRFLNALLTGNIKPAAELKMRLVGFSHFFQVPGAFGDDSHDRRELPAIAAARINQCLCAALKPAQFIIIGDTPNDIACARHFGARAIAVATGRAHSANDLLSHKPDAILPDLTDSALLMQLLEAA
jgi:phosphoglycolate phosphatase-like HAD superfamily hydrolase